MEDIAPEYDVVVLGTGMSTPQSEVLEVLTMIAGLTECVLSG